MLFPVNFVQTLIDAVFSELRHSQDRLHGLVADVDVSSRQRLFFNAGDRLIEHSKKFLSRYIAHCAQNRYEINHYLMTGVILRDQRQVRTSLIEEILEGSN